MGDNKKVANGVVALSSAAVVAIYGAGYARTQEAADRFMRQASERRAHVPTARSERGTAPLTAARTASPVEAVQPAPPAVSPDSSATPAPPPPTPVDPRVTAPEAATTITAESTAKPTTTAAGSGVTSGAADVGAPAEDEEAAPAQTAASPAAPLPAAPPPAVASTEAATIGYKDGTYYGWGTCRHGDIQAAVTIESGRITVARVEQCLTRYSCNWVTPIFPRIVAKQGTTYDYVSGATESSDAFQDAVAEALSQAK